MKNKRKLFFYECKKLLLIPALMLGVYVIRMGIDLIVCATSRGNTVEFLEKRDGAKEIFLYAFYAVLMIIACYRVFADRKLYQKMRVNPEKLFLVRLAIVTLACAVCTAVLLGMGTAQFAIAKRQTAIHEPLIYETQFLPYENACLFAFQGKTPWYFLFCFSVAMSAGMTYSVAEFIANTVYSQRGIVVKALSFVMLGIVLFVMHDVPTFFLDVYTVAGKEFFTVPLPCGEITYKAYMQFWVEFRLDERVNAVPFALARCGVAWNISNIVSLIIGLCTVAFGFFSTAFFNRKQNEGYFYGKKREVKTDEEE